MSQEDILLNLLYCPKLFSKIPTYSTCTMPMDMSCPVAYLWWHIPWIPRLSACLCCFLPANHISSLDPYVSALLILMMIEIKSVSQ